MPPSATPASLSPAMCTPRSARSSSARRPTPWSACSHLSGSEANVGLVPQPAEPRHCLHDVTELGETISEAVIVGTEVHEQRAGERVYTGRRLRLKDSDRPVAERAEVKTYCPAAIVSTRFARTFFGWVANWRSAILRPAVNVHIQAKVATGLAGAVVGPLQPPRAVCDHEWGRGGGPSCRFCVGEGCGSACGRR